MPIIEFRFKILQANKSLLRATKTTSEKLPYLKVFKYLYGPIDRFWKDDILLEKMKFEEYLRGSFNICENFSTPNIERFQYVQFHL